MKTNGKLCYAYMSGEVKSNLSFPPQAHLKFNMVSGEAYRRRSLGSAEGVTLPGKGDCIWTTLWRSPLKRGPKGQTVNPLISQAKGQSYFL